MYRYKLQTLKGSHPSLLFEFKIFCHQMVNRFISKTMMLLLIISNYMICKIKKINKFTDDDNTITKICKYFV